MFNSKLWQTSGHWQNYKDDMFILNVEKEEFALKPMNCPGHCVIFDSRDRSYKELPIRMAEFGVLHRNEASGALTGLTRVRRFVQDDTHIFCTPQQVSELSVFCLLSLGWLRTVVPSFCLADWRGDCWSVRFPAARLWDFRIQLPARALHAS
jgi:threonyl-tRNA synthetase